MAKKQETTKEEVKEWIEVQFATANASKEKEDEILKILAEGDENDFYRLLDIVMELEGDEE